MIIAESSGVFNSNPITVLTDAEKALTDLFEPIRTAITDPMTGDDDDVFLICGTAIFRARMQLRDGIAAVRRRQAEQQRRRRCG
jgi:hypothetical protein